MTGPCWILTLQLKRHNFFLYSFYDETRMCISLFKINLPEHVLDNRVEGGANQMWYIMGITASYHSYSQYQKLVASFPNISRLNWILERKALMEPPYQISCVFNPLSDEVIAHGSRFRDFILHRIYAKYLTNKGCYLLLMSIHLVFLQ